MKLLSNHFILFHLTVFWLDSRLAVTTGVPFRDTTPNGLDKVAAELFSTADTDTDTDTVSVLDTKYCNHGKFKPALINGSE